MIIEDCLNDIYLDSNIDELLLYNIHLYKKTIYANTIRFITIICDDICDISNLKIEFIKENCILLIKCKKLIYNLDQIIEFYRHFYSIVLFETDFKESDIYTFVNKCNIFGQLRNLKISNGCNNVEYFLRRLNSEKIKNLKISDVEDFTIVTPIIYKLITENNIINFNIDEKIKLKLLQKYFKENIVEQDDINCITNKKFFKTQLPIENNWLFFICNSQ